MVTIDLAGRTALVVGGSRGIGASIVEHFCRAGAYTVFTHTGNPGSAGAVESLLEGVRREGGAARGAAADARDGSAMRALADGIVAERGRIDTLVCNAGMNTARPADTETDEQWEQSIALNLGTAWFSVRAVLPHMLSAGYGRIILIGSSAVYDGGGRRNRLRGGQGRHDRDDAVPVSDLRAQGDPGQHRAPVRDRDGPAQTEIRR